MQGERIELAQIFLVACPSFILFGYNQSGVGGLVDFPSHQTISCYRHIEHYRGSEIPQCNGARCGDCLLHYRCPLWIPHLHMDWRYSRSSSHYLHRSSHCIDRTSVGMYGLCPGSIHRRQSDSRIRCRDASRHGASLAIRMRFTK